MAEAPPEVERSLTAEEQDAKFIEINTPLLTKFGELPDRLKVLVLYKYTLTYGGLPTPPPPPEPAPGV